MVTSWVYAGISGSVYESDYTFCRGLSQNDCMSPTYDCRFDQNRNTCVPDSMMSDDLDDLDFGTSAATPEYTFGGFALLAQCVLAFALATAHGRFRRAMQQLNAAAPEYRLLSTEEAQAEWNLGLSVTDDLPLL